MNINRSVYSKVKLEQTWMGDSSGGIRNYHNTNVNSVHINPGYFSNHGEEGNWGIKYIRPGRQYYDCRDGGNCHR